MDRYLSRKVNDAGWGRAVVQQLADHIQRVEPDSRGFSAQSLWRMKQLYETYTGDEKLSALLRELPWTHNMLILSKGKDDEVVEYALSRTLSPALVSEYKTLLPDKQLLRRKLHEFYELEYKESKD